MPELPSDILAQILAAQLRAPLEIHSVSDRGVPNKERVNLRVNSRVALVDYFLHAGIFLPNGQAVPIPNLSLWLGQETIDAGSWVVIYTGPGEHRLMTQTTNTKEPLLVLHWHVPTIIFHNQTIVPLLIKIDRNATLIGKVGS